VSKHKLQFRICVKCFVANVTSSEQVRSRDVKALLSTAIVCNVCFFFKLLLKDRFNKK